MAVVARERRLAEETSRLTALFAFVRFCVATSTAIRRGKGARHVPDSARVAERERRRATVSGRSELTGRASRADAQRGSAVDRNCLTGDAARALATQKRGQSTDVRAAPVTIATLSVSCMSSSASQRGQPQPNFGERPPSFSCLRVWTRFSFLVAQAAAGSAIRTSCLPRFSPVKRRRNASGAFSRPSTMSTRSRSFPSPAHRARSAIASGKRVA